MPYSFRGEQDCEKEYGGCEQHNCRAGRNIPERRNQNTCNGRGNADDASCTYFNMIHQYGIHSHQNIFTNVCSVNDGTMSDVDILFQVHGHPRKHMNHAMLLDIASVLHNDFPEIPPQNGKGPHINVCTYPDAARDTGQRMYEGRRMDERPELLVAINHNNGQK